jgi:hypothetical protein
MPRKKTLQPIPNDSFYLKDGTHVIIIDKNCWPIGRGQHSARDFEYKRVYPIMSDLMDIYLKPNGPKEVYKILSSPSKFSNHIIYLEGVFDKDKVDGTNARKYWYKKVKERFETLLKAKQNKLL